MKIEMTMEPGFEALVKSFRSMKPGRRASNKFGRFVAEAMGVIARESVLNAPLKYGNLERAHEVHHSDAYRNRSVSIRVGEGTTTFGSGKNHPSKYAVFMHEGFRPVGENYKLGPRSLQKQASGAGSVFRMTDSPWSNKPRKVGAKYLTRAWDDNIEGLLKSLHSGLAAEVDNIMQTGNANFRNSFLSDYMYRRLTTRTTNSASYIRGIAFS